MNDCERVPLVAPRWLTPGLILVVATTLSSIALVCRENGPSWDRSFAPLAGSVLLSAVLIAVHVARRSEADGVEILARIGWGIILGPLVAGTLMASDSHDLVQFALHFLLSFGVHFVFGTVFIWPFVVVLVAAIKRDMNSRALDVPDRSLMLGGAWLVVTNATLWACYGAPLRSLPVANVALGAFVALVAAARRLVRQAWYGRVRRGAVPGWAVFATTAAPEVLALPSLFACQESGLQELLPTAPVGVLARTTSEPGPYRGPIAPVPVAVVKL